MAGIHLDSNISSYIDIYTFTKFDLYNLIVMYRRHIYYLVLIYI